MWKWGTQFTDDSAQYPHISLLISNNSTATPGDYVCVSLSMDALHSIVKSCIAHSYRGTHHYNMSTSAHWRSVYPFIDKRVSLWFFALSGMSGMQSIVLIAQQLGPSPSFHLKGYIVTTLLTCVEVRHSIHRWQCTVCIYFTAHFQQ